jgi:hypothetical protein
MQEKSTKKQKKQEHQFVLEEKIIELNKGVDI